MCQETNDSRARMLLMFSALGCLASSTVGLVCWRDFRMTAQTRRGCTTHVLRRYRRQRDDCQALSVRALRPRN